MLDGKGVLVFQDFANADWIYIGVSIIQCSSFYTVSFTLYNAQGFLFIQWLWKDLSSVQFDLLRIVSTLWSSIFLPLIWLAYHLHINKIYSYSRLIASAFAFIHVNYSSIHKCAVFYTAFTFIDTKWLVWLQVTEHY